MTWSRVYKLPKQQKIRRDVKKTRGKEKKKVPTDQLTERNLILSRWTVPDESF